MKNNKNDMKKLQKQKKRGSKSNQHLFIHATTNNIKGVLRDGKYNVINQF